MCDRDINMHHDINEGCVQIHKRKTTYKDN